MGAGINAFNVGKDLISIVITTPLGIIQPTLITEFHSKEVQESVKRVAIDGVARFAKFKAGWEGSIVLDRANSVIDDYTAAVEQGYYAGNGIPPAIIQQTIQELSGAITQWQYTGVLFELTNAGRWKGDTVTEQQIDFVASRRIKFA